MNRLTSSLSIVLLLALCFLTQAAQAYTCADVPSNVNGNVTITESGACTIDHPVTATGKITISAGSSINAQGFSADAEVDLSAPGDITIDGGILATNYFVHVQGGSINVSGPVSTVNQGNILLVAQQNLATGTISAAPGFNIDLKANVAGGNVPFTIGSSGQSNGVNGAIIAHTYGYQPWLASAIVYVTNGDSNSTGGITVTDPASLSLVANGRERAGYLYLNAQKGTLSLPSGAIALDGTATAGAGVIGLMADTVAFGADAILSASEAIPQSTMHGIAISANTITYQGVDGLKLLADGRGYAHDYRGFVRIFPAGGIDVIDNQDPSTLFITGNYVLSPPGGVAIVGDAGSPLLISANGSHNLVSVVGQPLSFAGGAVSLSAQGVEDHNIEVLSAVGSTLTFASTGDVLLDATAQNDNSTWGTGGTIDFYAGTTSITAPQIRFLSDGPTGASGSGGIVNIVTTAFNLDAASKGSVSANGTGGGDASSNAITFNPGNSDFKIGSGVGQISFSARGGADSGSGGVIWLLGNSSAVTVYGAGETSTTIDVSAPGSDGNGGEIHLTANNGLTFDGTSSFLKADGGSSAGAGGKIVIHTAVKPVVIGVGEEGSVSLSANAHGFNTEKGGSIEVLSPAGIKVDTAHLSVLAGESGDGGTIFLDAGASMLTLNGDLIADGGISMGNGGAIVLAADGLTLPATANTVLRANSASSGIGGIVSVSTHNQGVIVGEDVEQLKIEAKGGDYSDGGSIVVNSDSEITIHGLAADVSAGQKGGNVTVSTLANLVIVGDIKANGGDFNGDGGIISLTAAGFSLPPSANTKLFANGGGGTGSGGSITIATHAQGITVGNEEQKLRLEAKGGDQGDGGWVTINSDFNIDLDGAAIDVSTTGNDGGKIVVTTPADITSIGELDASGGCSADGDGGKIELHGNDVSFERIGADGGNSQCTLASMISHSTGEVLQLAAGGVENKDGGNVTVKASELVTILDVSILPSSLRIDLDGKGDGHGGTLTIENPQPLLIWNSPADSITAKGGKTGEGGKVIIQGGLSDAVDLNSIINVDPGDDLNDVTKFAGFISIKDTTCQQWKIPAASGGNAPRTSWPLRYWDCTVGHDIPSAFTKAPSELASEESKMTNLRPIFNANKVEIYVFDNEVGFNQVFADNKPSDASSVTVQKGDRIYVCPWLIGSVGVKHKVRPYIPSEVKEVTAHEFGHALDIILSGQGGPVALPSVSETYKSWVTHDTDTLDYVDDAKTIQRLACAKTPINPQNLSEGYYSGGIPFKDVNDLRPGSNGLPVPICQNGAINPAIWPTTALPPFNSALLGSIESTLWVEGIYWLEPHAQSFGYGLVGNQGARPMNDTVMDNGFFPCLKSWANTERLSGAGPASNAVCTLKP